jgi:hypothetical protein
MTRKRTPETALKRAATQLVRLHGGFHLPIPGGAYGVSGAPDRIVFYQGRAYAVEFKAPGRKLGPAQERIKAAIEAAGCPYLVVRSLEDLAAGLGIRLLTG